MVSAVLIALAAVAGVALAAIVVVAAGRREARERLAAARVEANVLRRGAELEATALRRAAQTRAREEALELGDRSDRELGEAREALVRREEALVSREAAAVRAGAALEDRGEELDARHEAVVARKKEAGALRRESRRLREELRGRLEELAGTSADELAERLQQSWLEDARAEAAHTVRAVEQAAGDPSFGREAHRLMDISVSRYRNHFLTERNISNVPVGDGVADLLVAGDGLLLRSLEEVANVQLHPSDSGGHVKLEGLDGVGREIARRALSRLTKKPKAAAEAQADPVAWATQIKTQLEREILGLGKKAFAVLEIPKAHPEIVDLVGRLNYRTSYTQNQWLHAVEASFLCGMIASEMGLDVKLARRATLMHDIGKALTHKMEGSHAVIGADIARRLGEQEVVANAIGAHHADEPPGSVYAYLVAAADAMSGARPGARREHEGGYSTRLDDLERIGRSYRGVDSCYAVHGGRELRVYVRERELSDLDAVELSSEIAERVSEEMVFPGQIKVTIIRATEAIAVAG